MIRLFSKIFLILLLTNLVVIGLGYWFFQWFKSAQLENDPLHAPRIISEKLVDAHLNDRLLKLHLKQPRVVPRRIWIYQQDELVFGDRPLRSRALSRITKYPDVVSLNRRNRDRENARPLFLYANKVERKTGEVFHVYFHSRFSPDNIRVPQKRNRYMPIALGVLALLLGSALLSYLLAHPIYSLRKSTQKLGKEDLTARADHSVIMRKDLIGDLGRDFNAMACRVEQVLLNQQQLLRDVSHELRSPLARIQVANSLAEKKYGDISELSRIEQETENLDNLIENLLSLSRLSDAPTLNIENVSLNEILEDLVEDANFEFQDVEKTTQLIANERITLNADHYYLKSAFENILRNGMTHTKKGTTVAITLIQETQHCLIHFEDQGTGVSEENLGRLFDPFFRGDMARDVESRSHGVGLAITQTVINLHKGKVWAKNKEKNSGLIVSVSLPYS